MQDKEEERSLINVEAKLTRDGFTKNFRVCDDRLQSLENTEKSYGVEDVRIVDFYRFEGENQSGRYGYSLRH
jgi:hypothetical protein